MIIVTGATGFIGHALCAHLCDVGMPVCAVSRNPRAAAKKLGPDVAVVSWDELLEGGSSPLASRGCSIVNLAGENVGRGSWNAERRDRILGSRLDAVSWLMEGIARYGTQPGVFIQASAIGYYGDGGDRVLTEDSPAGNEFLSGVAQEGELASARLAKSGVRTVSIRTAVVLGANGGALPRMIAPFRWYVGGVPGNGRQYVSWIHLEDEVRAIAFLLQRSDLSGPFNLASPNPVKATAFFKALGRALGKPAVFPLPSSVIRMLMGQKGDELLLSSKRAVPRRLLDAGFEFTYPELQEALREILGKRDTTD